MQQLRTETMEELKTLTTAETCRRDREKEK